MNLRVFLSIIAFLLTVVPPVLAQEADEILSLSDVDELSEAAWLRLLEAEAQQQLSGRHNVIVRYDQCLNRRAGFRNRSTSRTAQSKAYLGDPCHETVRYNYKGKSRGRHLWQAGLVLDKDAGEEWSCKPPFADSFSAYAAYENRTGLLRQVLLGHYRIKTGCGLLCNQQFSLGKNLTSAGFFQHVKGLTAHSSASEDNFMQGAAVHLRLNERWALIPFVSARQIDGTLKNDTLTSWITDGYHRTRNEVAKRRNAWLSHAGLTVRRHGEWYAVSANVLYSHLDKTYQRALLTYNTNCFRGHQLLQGSADYEARWTYFHMKGETAIDDRGGWATVNALRYSFLDAWNLTVLYRQYSKRYRQLLGSSVSESSAMQGERGEMLLLEGPLSRLWDLQLTADFFQFSQAQYDIWQPSEGYELTARVNYASSHEYERPAPFSFSFRYRLKAKYRNNSLTDAATDLTPYYRHSFFAVCNRNTAAGLSLKTQLHGRLYSAQNTGGIQSGWALSQACGWKRAGFPLQAHVQGTWFRADNYDCRLYLSEKNILYGFGLPMLYGEGIRLTCTFICTIRKHLSIDAKYARTVYRHTSAISSGLQQISGNHQDNIWIQMRIVL